VDRHRRQKRREQSRFVLFSVGIRGNAYVRRERPSVSPVRRRNGSIGSAWRLPTGISAGAAVVHHDHYASQTFDEILVGVGLVKRDDADPLTRHQVPIAVHHYVAAAQRNRRIAKGYCAGRGYIRLPGPWRTVED
jgi:hypothetical protein